MSTTLKIKSAVSHAFKIGTALSRGSTEGAPCF
jgi:hypothetical protein